jgi:hypothetical protein
VKVGQKPVEGLGDGLGEGLGDGLGDGVGELAEPLLPDTDLPSKVLP